MFPSLLNPLRRKMSKSVRMGLMTRKPVMPCSRRTGASHYPTEKLECGTVGRGHPRNEAVTALKAGELAQWKGPGYHQRLKPKQPCTESNSSSVPLRAMRNYKRAGR